MTDGSRRWRVAVGKCQRGLWEIRGKSDNEYVTKADCPWASWLLDWWRDLSFLIVDFWEDRCRLFEESDDSSDEEVLVDDSVDEDGVFLLFPGGGGGRGMWIGGHV